MGVVLTNLSDKLYQDSRFRLNESAKKHGVGEVNSYDFEEIKKSNFYLENRHILDQVTGMGYWLWKPYIILESLAKVKDNDVVIYSDSGIEIIESLAPLINICQKNASLLLFANGDFTNQSWTKRDCFVLMDCDTQQYWNARHCDASFLVCKKNNEVVNFLEKWLNYSCDERIITDMPNTCGSNDLSGFIEHRRDQSILSLLAAKHNIALYRMPSQFGNHYKVPEFRVKNEFNCVNQLNQRQVKYYSPEPFYNSPYGQLLDHHRSKNSQGPVEPSSGLVNKIINRIRRSFTIR